MRRRFSVLLVASAAVWTAILAPEPARAQSSDGGHPWFQRRCWPFLPGMAPSYPAPEVAPTMPPTPSPTPTPAPSGLPDIGAFGREAGGAIGGGSAAFASANISAPGGYLDNPIPFTNFRLRFDAAYNMDRPDRAEYFYAKCGCFMTRDAKGPPLSETRIDYQDISAYLEVATSDSFSVFLEAPYRFINPEVNANTSGFGDLKAGFKWAFLSQPDLVTSFQMKVYAPTGTSERGLGTHHVSIEPSLLLYKRLSERWIVQGQLSDFIPAGGSAFAGNILEYGAGVSYVLIDRPCWNVMPVAEVLGWTVLSGQELVNGVGAVSARGDTIVNAKFGVRFNFGGSALNGSLTSNSLYIGYGHAMTGDVWYKDIVRIEYRMAF